jgi:hypothetical protein
MAAQLSHAVMGRYCYARHKGNPNISIRNCIINNNTAWYGAGIIHHTNSPSQVLNCLIAGNRAGIDGGGIYNTETSSPIITNTTIAGNRAMRSGGGIYNTAKAQPLLANSILYGNSSGIINNYTSTVANYSIIQDADIRNIMVMALLTQTRYSLVRLALLTHQLLPAITDLPFAVLL